MSVRWDIALLRRPRWRCTQLEVLQVHSVQDLQKNVLNRKRWTTRQDLRLAIVIWIEKTYHRRRRQDSLGRLTPIECERLLQTAHAA